MPYSTSPSKLPLTLRSSAHALRWTLLAALGVTPCAGLTACGGSTAGDADGSGGTSTEGGTGGTNGSGGGTLTVGRECESPTPLLAGQDTGFIKCAQGFTNRVAAIACPSALPRDQVLEAGHYYDGMGGADPNAVPELPDDQCLQDSDCPAPLGFCATAQLGGEPGPAYGQYNYCDAGCSSDDDCGDGWLCECGSLIGKCVDASCKTDADCAGDGRCVGTSFNNGCYSQTIYACEEPNDECLFDGDCTEGRTCQMNGLGTTRTCEYQTCAIGRPFLVDFVARRAALEQRSDWLVELEAVSLDQLGATERERLAAYWSDVALMEHASIAAFARFALQLLSVGAPHLLLERTRAAEADEARHTRLCFTLAAQYGGRDVGPGTLSMLGALDDLSPETILATTVLEGCIGETRAALEAARARELCIDPVVREVLATIAHDESAHAELAWRFAAWLINERPALRAVFEKTLADARELAFGPTATAAAATATATSAAAAATATAAAADTATAATATATSAAAAATAAAAAAAATGAAETFAFAGSARFGVLDASEKARVEAEAWALVIDPSARALLRKTSVAGAAALALGAAAQS